MSTHSMDTEMSKLQQDAPVATLPTFSNSEINAAQAATETKRIKEDTRPFFLYPRDGLYGLL